MAKKQKLTLREECEATLRQNRSFGGGISKAVDHIMTERDELRAAVDELYSYCHDNIAYFPDDEDAQEMCLRIEALLERTRS